VDAEVTGKKENVGFIYDGWKLFGNQSYERKEGDRACTKPMRMRVPKLK
jgi:hypothetical protein